jgi:lipoprotein-releasing system permease protein
MLPIKLAVRFLTKAGTNNINHTGYLHRGRSTGLYRVIDQQPAANAGQRTNGSSPHITISSATDTNLIKDWRSIVARINQSGLAKTVSVSASGNAFTRKGTKNEPILIRGIDAQGIENIYGSRQSIYAGEWSADQPGVLSGRDLQEDADFILGHYLLVKPPSGTEANYRISGVYDLGVASVKPRPGSLPA